MDAEDEENTFKYGDLFTDIYIFIYVVHRHSMGIFGTECLIISTMRNVWRVQQVRYSLTIWTMMD